MVLLVNQELKMGKGKVAAQCAHAAVGVLQEFGNVKVQWFKQWSMGGQKKVALKAETTKDLHNFAQQGAYQRHIFGYKACPLSSLQVLVTCAEIVTTPAGHIACAMLLCYDLQRFSLCAPRREMLVWCHAHTYQDALS